MAYRKTEIENLFEEIKSSNKEEFLKPPHEGIFCYFNFQKEVRKQIIFKRALDKDKYYFNEAERDYAFHLMGKLIRRKLHEEISILRRALDESIVLDEESAKIFKGKIDPAMEEIRKHRGTLK